MAAEMASADPDAGYVCGLTEASIQKAREQLHEDPADRLGPVRTLREWILQQPHFKTDTKTNNLLRYLRVAKGSQLKARTLIENYARLEQEKPNWFKHIDPTDEKMRKFLDMGYLIPIGFNNDGELVLLERLGAMDPKCLNREEDKVTFLKLITAIYLYVTQDENVQVNGLNILMDQTGVTTKHQMVWTIDDIKVFARLFKDCTPCRLRSLQFYNPGAIGHSILSILVPFMPKKIRERIIIHGDNLESVYKQVGLPMEILPTEYLPDDYTGPRNKSLCMLIDSFKTSILSKSFVEYINDRTSDKYGLDESKRPSTSIPQASFRKLLVD